MELYREAKEAILDHAEISTARIEKAVGMNKPLPKSSRQGSEDLAPLKDRMRNTLRGTSRSPKEKIVKGETVFDPPRTARPDLNKPIPRLPTSPPTPSSPYATWSGAYPNPFFTSDLESSQSDVPKPLRIHRKPTIDFTDPFGPEVQSSHARSRSDPNSDQSPLSVVRKNSFSINETSRIDDDLPPVPPLPSQATTFYRVPPRAPHSTPQSTIAHRKPPPAPIPPLPSRSTFPQTYRNPIPPRGSSIFPITGVGQDSPSPYSPPKDVQYLHSPHSSSSSKYSSHPQQAVQQSHSPQGSFSSKHSSHTQDGGQIAYQSPSSSPIRYGAWREQLQHRKRSSLHVETHFDSTDLKARIAKDPSRNAVIRGLEIEPSSSVYDEDDEDEYITMSSRLSRMDYSAGMPHTAPLSARDAASNSDSGNEQHHSKTSDEREEQEGEEEDLDPYAAEETENKAIPYLSSDVTSKCIARTERERTELDAWVSNAGANSEDEIWERVKKIKRKMQWYHKNIEGRGMRLLKEEVVESPKEASAKEVGREWLRKVGRRERR